MSPVRQDAIAFGKVVSFYYGVRDETGRLLDRTAFGAPLTYLHGAGNVVPGLERALAGKSPGDRIHAVLPPDEAYGVRNESLVKKLPRAAIPVDAPISKGVSFVVKAPDGRVRNVHVIAVDGDEVTVDLNHPYAGKTLTFDVTVDAVRDATPDELAHGHPSEA
jgi:FKBP-type peptidyl-prolyl cis-trans isomerase SlyD